MQDKDKILSLINNYVVHCGGDPKNATGEADLAAISSLLEPTKEVTEALSMLERYLLAQSQTQMKTGLFSGAEGNMLFKLSQIKSFLGISK
jgi:hypothetical protein